MTGLIIATMAAIGLVAIGYRWGYDKGERESVAKSWEEATACFKGNDKRAEQRGYQCGWIDGYEGRNSTKRDVASGLTPEEAYDLGRKDEARARRPHAVTSTGSSSACDKPGHRGCTAVAHYVEPGRGGSTKATS